VFTIHNLAYQGWADRRWLGALGPRAAAFEHRGDCNPMAGAIRLADAVVAVSPTYATEILRPETGEGLHPITTEHAARIVGIRNGIDTARWNPATDPLLPVPYSAEDLRGRAHAAAALRRLAGFVDELPDGHPDRHGHGTPVIGLVARMAAQKGVDVAIGLAPLLESLPARMVIVGDGDPALVARARQAAEAHPGRVSYLPFDERTAHLVAAGADVMLVPSRFEPCGLTQMEAMAYGAVPVVNGVGGLRDTVVDDDRHPGRGTGFVADVADPAHLVDALHRALRARRDDRRWQAIRRRGMTADWSWRLPADAYGRLYRSVASGACRPAPAASNEPISLVDQPISLSTSEVCSPTRGANRNSPLGDRSSVAVSRT
jgi:starch synthase